MSQRWIIFGISSAFMAMSQLLRASTAVIATNLSHDLNLSPDDLGLLGAVFFYSSGLIQIPLGLLLDRLGPRRTLLILNTVGLAGLTVFAMAGGLTGGLAGRILIGLGMAANFMGPLTIFTRWFRPEEFGTVSGLLNSIGYLGSLLATTPLVLGAERIGWRGVFIILAGLLLINTIGMYLWGKDAPPDLERPCPSPRRETKLSTREVARILFSNRTYWAIALTAGLRYGAFAAIQTLWAGPFLMLHLGLAPATAGNVLLLLTIGVVVGSPLGGYLSDKVFRSRKKVSLVSLVLMVVCTLIITYWPRQSYVTFLAGVMFFFGLISFSGQLLYAHIKEAMPSQMSGTAMTGINFFVFIGAGVFLQGLGIFLGHGGGKLGAAADYQGAFLICSLALIASVLTYAFSREVHVPAATSKGEG